MPEESIPKIALAHTKNIRLLFAQMDDFQQMMIDHMRIYQELLHLSCEIMETLHRRHPQDEQVNEWMATAGLLMSHAPFHDGHSDYTALIEKTRQHSCAALAEQLKKPDREK